MEEALARLSQWHLFAEPEPVERREEEDGSTVDLRSVLCSSRDGSRVYALDRHGQLRVAPVTGDDRPLQAPRWVQLRPALRFRPVALCLSESDRFLALYDAEHCAVVDVSQLALHDDTLTATPLVLAVHPVGHTVSLARLLQVHWHPWSDGHLAVLASDGVLQLFDVLESSTAEQTLRVLLPGQDGLSTPPSAVAFGAAGRADADADGDGEMVWARLTLYLLRDADGAVFVLCPVAPVGAVLSTRTVEGLWRTASASVTSADASLRQRWLRECVVSVSGCPDAFRVLRPLPHFPAPALQTADEAQRLEDLAPALLLYERLLLSPEGEEHLEKTAVDAEAAPTVSVSRLAARRHRTVLLIRSRFGAHAVYVGWLDALKRQWEQQAPPESDAMDLPLSTVVTLTPARSSSSSSSSSTSSRRPMIGMAEAHLGGTGLRAGMPLAHAILTAEGDGDAWLVHASALRWWMNTVPGRHMSPSLSSSRFATQTTCADNSPPTVESALERALQHWPPIANRALYTRAAADQPHPPTLEEVEALATIAGDWEQTVRPLRALYLAQMRPVIDALPQRFDAVEQLEQRLRQHTETLAMRAHRLQQRCHELIEPMNENLLRRLDALEWRVAHRRPGLSAAEVEAFRQLRRYAESVALAKRRLAEMQSRVARTPMEPASTTAPPVSIGLRTAQREELQQLLDRNDRLIRAMVQRAATVQHAVAEMG
eukprot:ctg_468.g244